MRGQSIGAAVVVAVALGWPASAAAACSSAWVTFTEVAPSADRVVIGTVTDAVPADDYAPVFNVAVEEVLRGPAEAVIEVNQAVNNPQCLTAVLARNGDRIALATGGRAFESDDVASIAYLAGVPHRPDIEVMSRADVYAAAGVRLPDTAIAPSRRAAQLGWVLVGLAFTVLAARRRQQTLAWARPPDPTVSTR